jgi:hypothetical protein
MKNVLDLTFAGHMSVLDRTSTAAASARATVEAAIERNSQCAVAQRDITCAFGNQKIHFLLTLAASMGALWNISPQNCAGELCVDLVSKPRSGQEGGTEPLSQALCRGINDEVRHVVGSAFDKDVGQVETVVLNIDPVICRRLAKHIAIVRTFWSQIYTEPYRSFLNEIAFEAAAAGAANKVMTISGGCALGE